jgi:hypothetical protein
MASSSDLINSAPRFFPSLWVTGLLHDVNEIRSIGGFGETEGGPL